MNTPDSACRSDRSGKSEIIQLYYGWKVDLQEGGWLLMNSNFSSIDLKEISGVFQPHLYPAHLRN